MIFNVYFVIVFFIYVLYVLYILMYLCNIIAKLFSRFIYIKNKLFKEKMYIMSNKKFLCFFVYYYK